MTDSVWEHPNGGWRGPGRWGVGDRGVACAFTLVLTIAAIGAGSGCSKPRSADAPSEVAAYREMAAPPAMAPDGAVAGGTALPSPISHLSITQRTLIRNATLELIVADVDSAAMAAERAVAGSGGFVASGSSRRIDGFPLRNLSLRVPAEKLDALLATLRTLAMRVESESIETQDVTDQVVDLDARLRTLRATEEELLVLLRETRGRGGKTEDVMAVYRELTGIRTQIEQLDGQRRALGELAAMSTVNLTITSDGAERPIAGTRWRPGATARNCLRTLMSGIRAMGDFAIFTLIVLLPLGVLVALVTGLGIRLARGLIGRIRRQR